MRALLLPLLLALAACGPDVESAREAAPGASPPAQDGALATGTIVHDTVRSAALEGNPLGDSPLREAVVYLPPGYEEAPERRYPVLYLLHGFDGDARQFLPPPFSLAAALDGLIGAGGIRPMIVVMPDGRNRLGGSMYATSPATGRWEEFFADELPDHVDREYRTLAGAESRGVAGWSMGGFGALRLAMRRPDRFGAVYALSPCCLDGPSLLDDYPPDHSAWGELLAIRFPEEVAEAGFHARLLVAAAAARSTEEELPLFPALARDLLGGATLESRLEGRLAALRALRGIGFDAGSEDPLRHIPASARRLSEALDADGIPHRYEEYPGTHASGVPERLRRLVLPFFSAHLSAEVR